LDLDRTKAAYVGLQERRMVKDLITGLSSNLTLNPSYWIDPQSNNAYFVVAQYPEQFLIQFEDILNMPLVGGKTEHRPFAGGEARSRYRGSSLALYQTPFSERAELPQQADKASSPILLRDVAQVTRIFGPETVDHYNLIRVIDVLIDVPGNNLGSVASQIEATLKTVELPENVTILMKGEVDSMRAAVKGFTGVLPLAVLLIYLVMVGLFRSFVDPLVIIGAVPLGFIGVIWMLLLTGTSVNVESLIGSLMMIGIVVANSVLLVDFANNRMREGMAVEEAVVQAGRLRLRPVLMTALATIMGLTPMALGFGEGSEMNMPLARAVIGGLIAGTFLTLLFIPVLHAIIRGRSTQDSEASPESNDSDSSPSLPEATT
jgi:multidrug efflux pump subunit AcrB